MLAYDDCRKTHTIRRREYGWSKARLPTPFGFNGLAGVCVTVGVYSGGWFAEVQMPSFTPNACGSVKHDAAAIGSRRLRVEWQDGVDRQGDPNRTHLH